MSDEQLNNLASVLCIIATVPIGLFMICNTDILTILLIYIGYIPVYFILIKMLLGEYKKRKQEEQRQEDSKNIDDKDVCISNKQLIMIIGAMLFIGITPICLLASGIVDIYFIIIVYLLSIPAYIDFIKIISKYYTGVKFN